MKPKGYSFNTFKGVFVPSLLTILGVIMYLRFGWVLGSVGIVKTLIIVTLGTAVTFTTSLSLATLVTNSPVGAGGAYFVISRSLGIDAGAAIGITLYCAQALSISFYVSGFAESVATIFPILPIKIVAIITIIVIAVIVFYSTDIALKTQYFILALIALSLVMFFLGDASKLPPASGTFAGSAEPFWKVFAVFFPAVTGITAGLGMSGDLKNPARALTFGTLGAVIVSYGIYLAIPLFINHVTTDRSLLLSNFMVMADIAKWKWAVIAGLWGASLSSAIGSLLTAPRTMQALSVDRVLPRILGRGFGENNDPRVAVVLSFAIALTGVILGDLNLIAPVLSMFFLTTYGLINLSAAVEGLIGSPWWRPTFKIHWSISLFGAFLSFATMFMIDAGSSFIALFLAFGIYALTKRRRLRATWGDARSGILMWLVQQVVYKLTTLQVKERTWRPNLLVLVGAPASKWYLISLADALTRGRGIMTIASILPMDAKIERLNTLSSTMHSYLKERNIQSLVKILPSKSVSGGACDLMHSYGFGPIFPNTVLLGDPSEDNPVASYIDIVFTAIALKRNIIVVKEAAPPAAPAAGKGLKTGRIDVWWDQESQNAGLLLAIAFMMHASQEWHRYALQINVILTPGTEESGVKRRINATVEKMRLKAKVALFENQNSSGHFDIINRVSAGAGFVLLGLHSPKGSTDKEAYQRYFEGLMDKISPLPATGLVMAREDVDFDQLFVV
jgi:amino acid transporter